MSIFSSIKADFSDLSTDVGKFAKAFAKLFGKAPSAIQAIENFTSEVAPVITAAVALADPAAEPAVAAALATAETGLAAIEASAQAAVSGTSVLTALRTSPPPCPPC